MKKISVLVLLFFTFACENKVDNDENCAAVSCIANFSSLYFEILDKETRENLLKNNTYTLENIKLSNNDAKEITIDSTSFATTTLKLTDSKWAIGEFNYAITIADSVQIAIQIELDRDNETGCCGNRLFLKNIEINDSVFKPTRLPFKIAIE